MFVFNVKKGKEEYENEADNDEKNNFYRKNHGSKNE